MENDMNRTDFENELQRLTEGFQTALTQGRADALWQQFGEAKPQVMHEAVTRLLCNRFFPDYQQWLEMLRFVAAEQEPFTKAMTDSEVSEVVYDLAKKLSRQEK